jgi:uncharacterized protein (TIGR01777 family)
MRIFVTGGTGFIGANLVRALADRGDECVVLSRSGRDPWRHDLIRVIQGNAADPGDWQREVEQVDAVVNLAGERIVDPKHRWTLARKRLLKDSRINVTENVVAAIRDATSPPSILLSGSAIGFYGSRASEILDESDSAGGDFLATLSWEWERAARRAEAVTRVTLLRTGMVLGRGGGMLDALLPVFRRGLGGPWGSGDQWLSWIHMADQVGVMLFALDHDLGGPVNVTAPRPVTVTEFAATLGRSLGKRAILPAPAIALRLGLGQAASALLDSQRVVPRKALGSGYEFQFPELDRALGDLVARAGGN